MPQKKNPDVLELVRGHYHRLTGQLQTLATLPANLSGGYHRDLQLSKAAVMTCVQGTSDVLQALQSVAEAVRFHPDATEAACTPDLTATQQALQQVADGVPFRTAYRSAADPDAWPESVEAADLLAAYATDGSPGQERPDRLRARLDGHDWVA